MHLQRLLIFAIILTAISCVNRVGGIVPREHTLSFVGTAGGEATVSTAPTSEIPHNTATQFNATVAIWPAWLAQYEFNGKWERVEGLVTISGNSVILKSDATIRPVLDDKRYAFSVTGPKNGSIESSPEPGMQPYGTVVTLTAKPDTGYRFSAWSGDASGSNASATVTIDKNKSASAAFTEIPGTGAVYVWKGASGANTGVNWANAYPDLETAFTTEGADKTYWVAGGEYRVSDSSNISAMFTIPNNAKLYGGFSGFETSLNQRIWHDHPSIIHGGSDKLEGNPQNYLFRLEGTAILLDGFVFERAIRGCIVVRLAAALDTIENCILRNNVAGAAGNFRAIHINGTNTLISKCVFYNNGPAAAATSDGHAVTITQSGTGTKIVNCLLTGNSGPAIVNGTTNASLQTQIINCTIVNNATAGSEQTPGGISAVGSAIVVRGCILWGNTTSRTTGTQIDSAAEIRFSCIQDGIPGGILRQPAGSIYEYNTYSNPAFSRPTIPSNVADWYNSNDAIAPFLPTSADVINKASFANGRPDYDLRSRRRSSPDFDMGAIEKLDQ